MNNVSLLTAALVGISLLAIAPMASTQDWTGPYVGGHLGYGFQSNDDDSLAFDTNLDGSYGDTVRTLAGANAFSPGFCGGAPNANNAGAGCQDDDDGGVDVGARAGYDWKVGGVILGVIGELSYLDVEDNVTGFSSTPAAYNFKREVKGMAALRGRVGYPLDRILVYGTAGIARASVDRSFATTNTANSFTQRGGDDADGFQAGLGIERMGPGKFVYGVEYLYTSLSDDGYVVRVGPGTAAPTNPFLLVNASGTDMRRSSEDIDLHAVRFTVSYRFGSAS